MSKTPKQMREAEKNAKRERLRGDVKEDKRWRPAADDRRRPREEDENDEEMRAELLARLTHLAEASQAFERWEKERETYEANIFAALANGTDPPPPLRPRPGAPLSGDDYLISIISAPYEPD